MWFYILGERYSTVMNSILSRTAPLNKWVAGREVNFKVAMTFMLKAWPQSSPLLKMKEIFDIDALNNAVNLALYLFGTKLVHWCSHLTPPPHPQGVLGHWKGSRWGITGLTSLSEEKIYGNHS